QGKAFPDIAVWEALAEALDVTVAELFAGEKLPKEEGNGAETVRGLAGGSLLGGGSRLVFTAETTLQPECCSVVCGARRVLRRGVFTEEPAIRRLFDRRIQGVRFCPAPR
ncbi:hypothetical protein, partial [Alistipes finegoldii]|uniref:hypothetical protein n=1 Tax=Alistipes finegoldii TaxID=214856 RepID=UPI003AB1F672